MKDMPDLEIFRTYVLFVARTSDVETAAVRGHCHGDVQTLVVWYLIGICFVQPLPQLRKAIHLITGSRCTRGGVAVSGALFSTSFFWSEVANEQVRYDAG
jgi:hypothetical protein